MTGTALLAAIGNHLRGLPRHFELAERGAVFIGETRTAPCYRLLARGDEAPPHPGMAEAIAGEGVAIAAELFELPADQIAALAALSLPPISLALITLEDGRQVHGYLCAPAAAAQARDVSQFGGWRAFLSETPA